MGCIDGFVQDCSISIAWAMEILQPCTKPLIWRLTWYNGQMCWGKLCNLRLCILSIIFNRIIFHIMHTIFFIYCIFFSTLQKSRNPSPLPVPYASVSTVQRNHGRTARTALLDTCMTITCWNLRNILEQKLQVSETENDGRSLFH